MRTTVIHDFVSSHFGDRLEMVSQNAEGKTNKIDDKADYRPGKNGKELQTKSYRYSHEKGQGH